jgi:hypothetical protein
VDRVTRRRSAAAAAHRYPCNRLDDVIRSSHFGAPVLPM